MQFQCPSCKSILSSDAVSEGQQVQCPMCAANFACHAQQRRATLKAVVADPETNATASNGELPDAIHSRVASAIGIEKIKGFHLGNLFSETFARHSREEVEESFTVGTVTATPDILAVDASWPKPWLFMRLLLASLLLYGLFWLGWEQFENPNLIPGWIIIGSFSVPISVLILFFELNVRRNVSLYMVVRLTFLGGLLSLLMTLALYKFVDTGIWGMMAAGPIEETGKVLAMIAMARAAHYRYKLNGLLIGAAVGVGFAAFESAGYAMNSLLGNVMSATAYAARYHEDIDVIGGGIGTMRHIMVMRGLLSPFGHIVWSAIAGCGLWRVIKGRPFQWAMLCDVDFVRLFMIPVILHMIWDAPFDLPFYLNYLILGAAGWFVCLSLVQEGLHEIAAEKARVAANAAADQFAISEEGIVK